MDIIYGNIKKEGKALKKMDRDELRHRILQVFIIILFNFILFIDCYSREMYIKNLELQNKEETAIKLEHLYKILPNSLDNINSIKENSKNKNYKGTLDDLQFIVEVIDIEKDKEEDLTVIKGKTVMPDLYMGVLFLEIRGYNKISKYETHVFNAEPLMTMSKPTTVKVISYKKASENDKQTLQNNKQEYSNYNECMVDYKNMTLDKQIENANFNYGRWTDEQIVKYQENLTERGYNESTNIQSEVYTIDQLKQQEE